MIINITQIVNTFVLVIVAGKGVIVFVQNIMVIMKKNLKKWR